jgi:hypothetical protein
MKPFRRGIGLVAAIALLSAAPVAAQEVDGALVPPENSAVNQYTEAYPTAGGERNADKRKGRERSPKQVLGSRKEERLHRHGDDGAEVAEVVAETAPVAEPEQEVEESGAPAPGGSGGGQGGGAAESEPAPGPNRSAVGDPAVSDVSGSSGVGEIVSQATGSSSPGGIGLLLPLLIVATALWAFTYAIRHRRPVD